MENMETTETMTNFTNLNPNPNQNQNPNQNPNPNPNTNPNPNLNPNPSENAGTSESPGMLNPVAPAAAAAETVEGASEGQTQETEGEESNVKGYKESEEHEKIRMLLFLWDMDGFTKEVKRGDLNKRMVRTKEKSHAYEPIIKSLEDEGAIVTVPKNRSVKVSITEKGMEMLVEGVYGNEFKFSGNQVGTRVPNALLKWIRTMKGIEPGVEIKKPEGAENEPEAATTEPAESAAPVENVAPVAPVAPPVESTAAVTEKVQSYEAFKTLVLETYDRLNSDYSLQDLVPIYRLRRDLGEKVDRANFNTWLIEMQSNDIVELTSGEMSDQTPDKREDSITLPGGAFRYYIKKLS